MLDIKRLVLECVLAVLLCKGEGFDVMKSGDARVALIGFPSVGKVCEATFCHFANFGCLFPLFCIKCLSFIMSSPLFSSLSLLVFIDTE